MTSRVLPLSIWEDLTVANEQEVFKIILKNKIAEISRLGFLLRDLSVQWNFDSDVLFRLDLVLDELVTNIISYAYQDTFEHEIELRLKEAAPHHLEICIIDDGKPFDPLLTLDPDLTVSLENRKIGGLGIHFARKFAESLSYQREENLNKLFMKINLKKTGLG